MIAHAFQVLVGTLGLWVLWRILNPTSTKSDLDRLPGPSNDSFIEGNLSQYYAPDSWDWHTHISTLYGRAMRIWGPFGSRFLLVSDPLALDHILVKDAYEYVYPEWFLEGLILTLGKGLLAVTGHNHKKQRKMLSVVFSTTHMKEIVPMFYDVAYRVRNAIAKRVADQPQELDMLEWSSRLALELIGSAGLGHSFDNFDKDSSPSPYVKAVKQYLTTMQSLINYQQLLPFIRKLPIPDRMAKLFMERSPFKRFRSIAHIASVMHTTSVEILNAKLRAIESGDTDAIKEIGEGRDLISILLKANRDAAPEDRITNEEVLGQISSLTFAVFDTTSSAISKTIHLLSHNTDIQDRLRAEIREAFRNGNLAHDDLVNLPYLDAVCRETMRVSTPILALMRQNVEDMVLPVSRPIICADGKEISSIHVPKGTNIVIDILASNTDKITWGEDALEWKPDRWMKPLPKSVVAAQIPGVYSNLMTFSGGARSCIGFRFSQLEMKVVLSVLLKSFIFEPAENKKVKFNRGTVIWPEVVGGSGRPEFPVKVSALKSD